jgi:hypothetical protein
MGLSRDERPRSTGAAHPYPTPDLLPRNPLRSAGGRGTGTYDYKAVSKLRA